MKKILSITVCLVLLILCSPFVYASSNIDGEVSTEQFVSYAYSIIPDLAKLPDVALPEAGLYISQPLIVENSNDSAGYVFFLFDQNVCIGELTISYLNGNFFASFLSCQLSAVSAVYVNAVPFYLLSVDGALVLRTASTFEIISGRTLPTDQLADTITQYESEMVQQYTLLELSLVPPIATPFFSGLPYTSATLDVPIVANQSVNTVGICWAASAASVIRYLRGYASVTAMNVYNTVYDNLGTAIGTSTHILNGLTSYGVNNYAASSSTITLRDITAQINAGYPVILAIVGVNMSLLVGHSVVVSGYYCESDGTNYIQIVDSNEGRGKLWLSLNGDTNTFYYRYSGIHYYTYWDWSVYARDV